MPDWISHILLGLIIAELLNVKKKSLIVLGSILPDIILKTYTLALLTPVPLNFMFWFFYPLHTIAGVLLFSFLLTLIFQYDAKKTFLLVSIGAVFHILLDMTTKPILYNIQGLLLFPFSWQAYSIGLFYSEQYWIVLLILLGIYLIIKLIGKLHLRNINKSN